MLRTSLTNRLRARSVNWTGIAGKMENDAAKSEVARLRQLYDSIAADNAAVASAVEPIDFGAYKASIKSAAIVGQFESAYGSLNLPSFVAEEVAEAEQVCNAMVSDAETAVQASKARIEELESIISAMKENRLSKDTTVGDVVAMYPEIGAEVEAEINEMDWQK